MFLERSGLIAWAHGQLARERCWLALCSFRLVNSRWPSSLVFGLWNQAPFSRTGVRPVRRFLERLDGRGYAGAMILEQWANPPEPLLTAATRLAELNGQEPLRERPDQGDFPISS